MLFLSKLEQRGVKAAWSAAFRLVATSYMATLVSGLIFLREIGGFLSA